MLKKSLAIGIILLFISSGIIPVVISNNPISTKTIYVDDDNVDGPWDGSAEYPYQTIRDGVNASSDGDTVFVRSGTYQDYEILITTSIDLKGEDKTTTIIEEGQIILLRGATSSVSGFTINHCYVTSEQQEFVEIYDNIIFGGISSIGTNISSIHHNNINCEGVLDPQHVILVEGGHTTIEHNVISGAHIGIILSGGTIDNELSKCDIKYNKICNNIEGLSVYVYEANIDFVNICHNKIYDNENGLVVYGFDDNIDLVNIQHNNFIQNKRLHATFKLETGTPFNFIINKQFHKLFHKNYWDNSLGFLPKPIIGLRVLGFLPPPLLMIPFPGIIWDKNPSRKPYDIPILEV